jgi:hypothetical protein
VTVVCRQTTNATVIMIATTTAANTLSMSDIGCYVARRATKVVMAFCADRVFQLVVDDIGPAKADCSWVVGALN